MAHLGVLFLDELPEFQRAVLDSLRQPLETGEVTVARANAHVTFPARVQLIAAMNPCRCGHLGDPGLACHARRAVRGIIRARFPGRCSTASTCMSRWIGACHRSGPGIPAESSAQVAARVHSARRGKPRG
jgi:magnesium chelatase family protein